MNVDKMVKGHEVFRSLPFEDVERVSNFSSAKLFDKGAVVFQEGRPASHVFVLLEGKVDLRLPAKAGELNLVVDTVERGEMFGLAPLLGAERYTTTACCAEKSSVLCLEAAPLRAVLDANPYVALKVMRIAAQAYFDRYVETLRHLQETLNRIARGT
jgi:CRP-like cAMP-binding protein